MSAETLEPGHVISELGIANLAVYQKIMASEAIGLSIPESVVLTSD